MATSISKLPLSSLLINKWSLFKGQSCTYYIHTWFRRSHKWIHSRWYSLADQLNTLTWEEANLKPILTPPPRRVFRRGHVYYRYHVTDLKRAKNIQIKNELNTFCRNIVKKWKTAKLQNSVKLESRFSGIQTPDKLKKFQVCALHAS